jgi:hypothetical protein
LRKSPRQKRFDYEDLIYKLGSTMADSIIYFLTGADCVVCFAVEQGDRIGRIFANWVVVNFWAFFFKFVKLQNFFDYFLEQ